MPRRELHFFDGKLDGWLEPIVCSGDVLKRLIANLLPYEVAIWFRTDDYFASTAIRKRAKCLHGLTQLTCGTLELESAGFTVRDELSEIASHEFR